MQLFRSNIITYEEALRQSSNPDDFALRVSGISATSDSTWDNFDKKDEQPQNGKPSARPAAAGRPSSTAVGRVGGGAATTRPGAAPAKQPASESPPGDDDFQIERF
ncbi:MAG TPA: type IV pili twitching motility protein PilT, partial [Myxococcales bacterium]|nr:type IV pili twitching motility protein PilT [Myxococcales bacterium]